MDSDIICSNCNQQYCDENLPRLLIACGHTFCQNCLFSFIQQHDGQYTIKCPQDQMTCQIARKSISKFPKNLALIKVIESKKQNSSFKQNQINVSKITKNSSVHEQEDANELINIINGSKLNISRAHSNKQKKEKPKAPKQIQEILCPTHKKPLDIVCIVDLKKICAGCAIFGDHRGHSFKSLQQVSQIQTDYCNQINDIINEKQKLSKQITCTETKNDLIGLLTAKRNKLRSKILEQYQKIQTKLANKKKQVLKKLDQITKKQQANFKNCMKFDQKLIKSYDEWFKKSDSQLKILQQSDFQARLILLFEGKNIDGDLIEEGNQIIDQMKIQQQNIMNQVQKKLQNLNVNVNQEIHDYIDNFINVTSENYKQISAIIIKSQPQTLQLPLSQINSNTIIKSIKNNDNLIEKNKQQTPKYQFNKNSYLKVRQSPTHLDQSLLENEEEQNSKDQIHVVQFNPRMSAMVYSTNYRTAPLTQRRSIQPNIQTPIQKPIQLKLKGLKSPPIELCEVKVEKMSKKKLARLKLPDRYQKIVEALLSDTLQILDLTNAEIGDSNTATICENIVGSKVRTLKLIRNKLTDEGIPKILPYLTQITTLNLSQNLLTQNVLDILFENKKYLPNIRTIILSQNKIIERKHKIKIDKLKKLQWNISV